MRYVKTPSKGRFFQWRFDGVFGGGGLFGGGFGGAAYHVGVLDGGVGFFHLGFERAEAVRDGDAVIAVAQTKGTVLLVAVLFLVQLFVSLCDGN